MRVCCAGVLVGLLFAVAPSALAQAPGEAPAESTEVREILREAVMEYGAAHYEEALALFQRAHALQPGARTLRGVGMAAFELRRYAESVLWLSASLEESERALTDAQREQVEALLARARRFVGHYRLSVTPDDAVITVDGRTPRALPDGRALLELGEHTLRAECDGYVAQTRRLDVAGGEDAGLELHLERVEAPAIVDEPSDESTLAVPSVAPPVRPIEAPTSTVSPSWVLLGMGGALLAGSLTTGLLALKDKAELDDACETMSTCPESLRGTRDGARRLSIATDILWATGAALVLGGVLWRVLGGADDEEPPAAAACGAEGCMVWLRGTL